MSKAIGFLRILLLCHNILKGVILSIEEGDTSFLQADVKTGWNAGGSWQYCQSSGALCVDEGCTLLFFCWRDYRKRQTAVYAVCLFFRNYWMVMRVLLSSSGLVMISLSTPLSKDASILSLFTVNGRVKARSNAP